MNGAGGCFRVCGIINKLPGSMIEWAIEHVRGEKIDSCKKLCELTCEIREFPARDDERNKPLERRMRQAQLFVTVNSTLRDIDCFACCDILGLGLQRRGIWCCRKIWSNTWEVRTGYIASLDLACWDTLITILFVAKEHYQSWHQRRINLSNTPCLSRAAM